MLVAECFNRFVLLAHRSDKKVTACAHLSLTPNLMSLADCFVACCNKNCNAINYQGDNRRCNIKRCTETGIILTDNGNGFDLYALIGI